MTVALFSEATVSTSLTLGTVPSARVGPSLASNGNKIYVFGGRQMNSRTVTNDLYCFDLTTMIWEQLTYSGEIIPPPRYFHSSCVYKDDYFIVTGGQGYQGNGEQASVSIFNDICIFDLKTKTWEIINLDLERIPARYAHLTSIIDDKLIIVGGQDLNNEYLLDVQVFSLTTKKIQLSQAIGNSFGAYRSTLSVKKGAEPIIKIFSNSRFSDVNREFITIQSDFQTNSNFNIQEHCLSTNSRDLPPGLRFPEGYIINNQMVISGTYLSNNTQSYNLWSLNMDTLEWRRIDTGSSFARGSWNRGILDPLRNRFIVFGHRDRDLVQDYNQRRINFTNISIVDLESFNIYREPEFCNDDQAQELGLMMMYEPRFSNFSLLTKDDFRIHINSAFLRSRWPSFDVFLVHTQSKDRDNKLQGPPNTLYLQESYRVVQAFVRYLYTNALDPEMIDDIDQLGRLLVFAHYYSVDHLYSLVAARLHTCLDIKNAPHIFRYSSMAARNGLKLRSLSLMIQERRFLVNDMDFWQTYPEQFREEIIRYMPPNFQYPHPLPAPAPSSQSTNSTLKSSSASIRTNSETATQGYFMQEGSNRISVNSTTPLTSEDAVSPLPTKKNRSNSSFLKFGFRRPSVANLFNFSSPSQPQTPTSSTPDSLGPSNGAGVPDIIANIDAQLNGTSTKSSTADK